MMPAPFALVCRCGLADIRKLGNGLLIAVCLLQRYVRKGNDAKNPKILGFFFVTEKNPVKCSACAVALKIGNAFAETCRFLTIRSLEFQKIWEKK